MSLSMPGRAHPTPDDREWRALLFSDGEEDCGCNVVVYADTQATAELRGRRVAAAWNLLEALESVDAPQILSTVRRRLEHGGNDRSSQMLTRIEDALREALANNEQENEG